MKLASSRVNDFDFIAFSNVCVVHTELSRNACFSTELSSIGTPHLIERDISTSYVSDRKNIF